MGNAPSMEDGSRGLPHKLSKRPRRRGPEQPPPPETFDYSNRYKNMASNASLGTTAMSGYTPSASYATRTVLDTSDQFEQIHLSVPTRDTLDSLNHHHPRLTPNASNDSLRRKDTGKRNSRVFEPDSGFGEAYQPHVFNPTPGDDGTNLPARLDSLQTDHPPRPSLHRAKTAPSSRPQSLPSTRQLPWDPTSTVNYPAEPVPRPLLDARVRRRSLNQVPGVATRIEMIKPVGGSRHGQSGNSITVVDVRKLKETRRASAPLAALSHVESPARAVTPNNAEYRGLGTVKFGSLHVTNGTRTPSPTPTSRGRLTSRFSISEPQSPLPQIASERDPTMPDSEPTPPESMTAIQSIFSHSNKNESPPESPTTKRTPAAVWSSQEPNKECVPQREKLDTLGSSQRTTPLPDIAFVPYPDSGYSSAISIQDKERLSLVEASTQCDGTSLVGTQTTSEEENERSEDQQYATVTPTVSQQQGQRPELETSIQEERLSRGRTLSTLSKRLPSLKRNKSRGSASVKSSGHSRNNSTETDASASTSSFHWPFNRRRKSLPNVYKVADTIDPVPPIPKDIEDRIRAGKIPRASYAGHAHPHQITDRPGSSTAWRSSNALLGSSKAPPTLLKRDSASREKRPQQGPSSGPSGRAWLWNQTHHTTVDLEDDPDDDYMADAVIDEAQIYDLQTTRLSAGNSAFDQALEAMNRRAPTGPLKQPQSSHRPQSLKPCTKSEWPLRHRSSAPDLQQSSSVPVRRSASEASYVPATKSTPPVSMHSQRARNNRTPSPGGPHMTPRRSFSQSGPYPGVTSSTYPHLGVPSPPHGQRSPRRPGSQQQGYFEPRREMASLPLWQQSQVIPEYGTRQHFRSHIHNTALHSPLHSQDGRVMNRRPSQRRSPRPHHSQGEPGSPLRLPQSYNSPAYRPQGVRTGGT